VVEFLPGMYRALGVIPNITECQKAKMKKRKFFLFFLRKNFALFLEGELITSIENACCRLKILILFVTQQTTYDQKELNNAKILR
jgi:hypothetical protein